MKAFSGSQSTSFYVSFFIPEDSGGCATGTKGVSQEKNGRHRI
jgi:hypothetical protein